MSRQSTVWNRYFKNTQELSTLKRAAKEPFAGASPTCSARLRSLPSNMKLNWTSFSANVNSYADLANCSKKPCFSAACRKAA
jgi:hypothetical protein